jgi:hypothetical protein
MPRVTVTKVDKSTKGKDRVYFDNRHNWQDSIYIGQACGTPPSVGMVIDADTSSTRFQNAKSDTWFFNRYSVVQGPITAGGAAQQTNQIRPGSDSGQIGSINMQGPQAGYIPPPAKPPAGWDIPTGDLSRFVSNVIGSAIAANLIKTPSEIAQWVGASYRAAESLRSGEVPEFDSDVPRFVEPDAAEQQQTEQGGFEEEDNSGIPF